jgi:1-acyl-sn-glycerol-3-phosphate acyltransferase
MKNESVPGISPQLRRWFGVYVRRYLGRHFNAVRLLKSAPLPPQAGGSQVFFLNHPSWWDPLVALFLGDLLKLGQRAYGPIDEAALKRYPFFRKLGFFPVERGTLRGARQFLSQAGAILRQPGNSLWITPQGRFTDVRERPVRFEAGMGHLAAKFPEVALIPVAVEFVWWFERSPEILIAFGAPVFGPDARCEEALAAVQDQLAEASQGRDEAAFETLLAGRAGVGGIYDLWRRFRALLRGESFVPNHQPPSSP